MIRILPDWTMELEEKLKKVILDIAAKNHIDIMAVGDSIAIENGMNSISHALVRLYDNYAVDDRLRLEEFAKEFEKDNKKKKKVKKK